MIFLAACYGSQAHRDMPGHMHGSRVTLVVAPRGLDLELW